MRAGFSASSARSRKSGADLQYTMLSGMNGRTTALPVLRLEEMLDERCCSARRRFSRHPRRTAACAEPARCASRSPRRASPRGERPAAKRAEIFRTTSSVREWISAIVSAATSRPWFCMRTRRGSPRGPHGRRRDSLQRAGPDDSQDPCTEPRAPPLRTARDRSAHRARRRSAR